MADRITCPWCASVFTPVWHDFEIDYAIDPREKGGADTLHAACCPNCNERILYFDYGKYPKKKYERIFPTQRQAAKAPKQVPDDIARDYNEAMAVIELSPKASATLARRCLQSLLSSRGYNGKTLYEQIRTLLDESDPNKRLPEAIRGVIDAIRHFGNFGAHPIKAEDTLKLVDVEDYEAELCLEMLRSLLEHYYVTLDRLAKERQRIEDKVKASGKQLQS
jgi:Domain of unknown function (DUF4145)